MARKRIEIIYLVLSIILFDFMTPSTHSILLPNTHGNESLKIKKKTHSKTVFDFSPDFSIESVYDVYTMYI